MSKMLCTIVATSALSALTAATNAELISGTITADNHYALFTSTGGTFTYHGGNETGPGGSPGTYNWSMAESYSIQSGDFLYIAAWSDDAVAQGVLAEFHSDGLGALLSGDSRWQVYGTDLNRGDGDPHPSALEIAGHVAFADANGLWEVPFVGDFNGVSPWGTIAGISGDARWMWKNVPGDPDPLNGGSGTSEMLIFRTAVPAPGALALLGLGGLVAIRRRR